MKLLKPKKRQRQNEAETMRTRRSLPVDRYYSSSRTKRKSGRDSRELLQGRRAPRIDTDRLRRSSGRIFTRILQWGGTLGIAAVLLYNIVLSGVGVKVQSLPSPYGNFRSNEEYVGIVEEVYARSLFNKSKLTLDSTRFEEELLAELPEAENTVAVVPLAGTKLQVGIEFATPVLRVQLGNLKQGVIGENGNLLYQSDTTDILSKFARLPLINPEPDIEVGVGDRMLTSNEVALLRLLMSEFDGSSVHRPSVASIVHSVEKREFRVSFEGVSYFAKLTSEREARPQVGALVATIEDLERRGQPAGQYIDVRVEGRVFIL